MTSSDEKKTGITGVFFHLKRLQYLDRNKVIMELAIKFFFVFYIYICVCVCVGVYANVYIYNLVCWGFWHINHCMLFNGKISLYIYIKYIRFGSLRFCGISTTVGYLMLISVYVKYIKSGLVWFYAISTIVGYLMPNPSYRYILNI